MGGGAVRGGGSTFSGMNWQLMWTDGGMLAQDGPAGCDRLIHVA